MAIEPITMVTRKPGPCAGCWKLSFADPTQDEGMTEDEFVARYYRHGLKYRALAGGADVGTAIVNDEANLGCESLAASLSPPLPDYCGAIAVGSLHVPPRKLVRREATAEETARSGRVQTNITNSQSATVKSGDTSAMLMSMVV